MSLLDPQLVAFARVAECKTVHGAAKTLHLTQTAVTQRIRQLEQKLKTTLFIRTRSGMRVTAEGEQLYRYCQRVNELAGETLAGIQGTQATIQSRVTIAGPSSIMRSRVMPRCDHIMKNFPNLYFTFILNDENDISQYLKSGEADIVIMQPKFVEKEMCSKVLEEEHYILLSSPRWKGRKLRQIILEEKIIDFNPTDHMTYAYLEKFDLLKYVKNNRHYINDTESIAQMFANGSGYGVLAKEFAQKYLESKQLIILNQGKSYSYQLMLAWYKRPESPSYFTQIIKTVS